MLTAANRRSLVDNTIDSIRAAILAGTWPIGARVPTETELASLLAVSRNTVREAVSALAHSGLLEVRQGDGTYVRSQTDATALPRVLSEASPDERLDLWRALDETLARLAAERRDFEDIARIATAIDEMFESMKIGSTAGRDLRRFHSSVADAAHNKAFSALYRIILSSISTLSPSGQNLLEAESDAGAVVSTQDEYQALLDAIIGQSPQDAARAARHLVDRFVTAVAGPQAEDPSPPS
ncbi:FadR/GntR family transcriptional regulator [Chelatococcus asaccharovorans]|uniref:GntR family transcriptional regulator n=1 Tax=Chelatococcus asaccharovorans TaxID=28210 RepID=A0A2V3U1Z4_9HYPH|nr:GntR family transcriptional regulator [Chelatococcus asaccharovorans]MBS7702293.1 FadR family transcriptional regulator [Chelatococcus asaccharovorans]PXW56506.1 GntR family transcriptional regulator [Chelatococcus asaccharovorans]